MESKENSSPHQSVLGHRIPHPPSTNFDYDSPTTKRIKREHSNDNSPTRRLSENGSDLGGASDRSDREDSGTDGNATDKELPYHATNLESALPPVKTDKEAIAEYEAFRAAEESSVSATDAIKERLGKRKWVKGRNSIYVDAFNLALETVLEEESHLFDEPELELFRIWREQLSYEAQYLYVRLFLRKTSAWHRINRLRYYNDIGDLEAALEELFQGRSLPQSSAESQAFPGELEPPPEAAVLRGTVAFADASDDHISSLEEASGLLMLDELKTLAKDAKVQGKNKTELLRALRKGSESQSGISWGGALKRSETEDSVKSEASNDGIDTQASNRDAHYTKKILENTGRCVRLSAAAHSLFERVHLVFYRSTEWTEKSLTTIILARISRKTFPDYVVSRSTNIFPSRSMLLEFEAAVRTQFRIDNILEFSGPVTKADLERVRDIAVSVYPRWRILLEEEQKKEDSIYLSGEGAYLRRFSPAWVYTRIIHKSLNSYARFKEHQREHELLVELLDQQLFHPSRRGAWYQRKALIEEHYKWALEPSEGRADDAQKRHWKKIALRTCEQGLEDRDCHISYHYDLQKRITKLERQLRVVKREQHDFSHVLLTQPAERTVEGIKIERETTTPPPPLVRRGSSGGNPNSKSDSPAPTPFRRGGGKTIWLDELEGDGDGECGVEEMCLSYYRHKLGYKGYHCEGRVVRTLFGFLLYDVLFAYVPNVFQTAYQTCPLDLHTDSFYPARFSEIAHALARISNGEALAMFRDVYDRLSEKEVCVVGVDWGYTRSDLEEILACFPGEALASVFRVMAQEYGQRGGGMPDLFLWHPQKKQVVFSEVKSENDRLSDTQRLWIHVLSSAGVKVELCKAVAREVRTTR